MSAQLKRIEKIASQKTITDPAMIASLTEHFLGRSLQSLVPPSANERNYMALLARDLAKGFGCSPDEVRKCSMGDVLMMFTRENQCEFFDIPYENLCIFDLDIKPTAGNCIYIAGIFHNYKNSDIRMKALMGVEVTPFIRFLKTALREEYARGNLSKQELAGRNRILDQALGKIISYCRSSEEPGTAPITLGRVLEISFAEANRPWSCHIVDLTSYAPRVVKGYDIANTLFMDCITNALVRTNPDRYERGVRLIKETNKFDENMQSAGAKAPERSSHEQS